MEKRNIPEMTSQMYILSRLVGQQKGYRIEKKEHGEKIIIEIYDNSSENPLIFAVGNNEEEAAKLAIATYKTKRGY